MAGITPTYGLRYPELVDPPDGEALGKNLALDVEAELARIDAETGAIVGGPWTGYTPAWTGTTTNPSIGNGSLAGYYRHVGRTVHYAFYMAVGSTTGLGAGQWRFSLPVPGRVSMAYQIPVGRVIASNLTRWFGGDVMYPTNLADRVLLWRDAGASEATFTPSTPFTWASGCFLVASGTYEAAADPA